MRVRLATVADAEAIGTIHVRAWQAAYPGLLPASLLAGLSIPERIATWRARLSATDLPERRVFVVESPDAATPSATTVRGFTTTLPSRDPDRDPRRSAELLTLYLAPEAWRRGLGSALFDHAAADLAARGFSELTLWVLASNARARAFYARKGLAPDGAEKLVHHDGHTYPDVRYHAALPLPAAPP